MVSLRAGLILMAFSMVGWTQANPPSMPSLWRYADPGAQMLAGVSWKGIENSPMGEIFRRQFPGGKSEMKGLDFAQEIDSIFVFSVGKAGGAEDNPPTLVAMSGKFDSAGLRKEANKMKAKVRLYKGAEIFVQAQNSGPMQVVALVNAQTILAGDEKLLRAAIDRAETPAPMPEGNTLFRRALDMASRNDIWMVASAPGNLMGNAEGAPPMMKEISEVGLGLAMREGLNLALDLHTKSPEAAQTLAMGAQAMMTLAAVPQGEAQDPRTQMMSALMQKLHIEPSDSTVRISFSMDSKEVEQTIASMKSSVEGALASVAAGFAGGQTLTGKTPGAVPVAARQPRAQQVLPQEPPEDPSKPKFIRIYGLDEGVREIPFGTPKK